VNDITQPLRLAVGTQDAGSGYACMMNVLSWVNGDTTITDMPNCTDPGLAELVYVLNDRGCAHLTPELIWCPGDEGGDAEPHTHVVETLCAECSIKVFDAAIQTVGTRFKFYAKSRVHPSPTDGYVPPAAAYEYYVKGWDTIARRVLNETPAKRVCSPLRDSILALATAIENAGSLNNMVAIFTSVVDEFKRVFATRLAPKEFTPEALAAGYEKAKVKVNAGR
jgi:hypothetical protein